MHRPAGFRAAACAGLALAVTALAGCRSGTAVQATPAVHEPSAVPTAPTTAAAAATPPRTAATHRAAPPRRRRAPAAIAFAASVEAVTAAQLPYSWRPGCPVAPTQLRLVRLTFHGFDGRVHQGVLVAAENAVAPLVAVFRTLYEDGFPIRRMTPIDAYRGSDDASMQSDNTSAFNCRLAVAAGPPSWSMHAYGEAIDVNPLENPYWEGGVVHPRNGGPYLDRADVRPGMAEPGGVLVAAFAAVGWGWGGAWPSTPDYQHFSVNGR